ncbi:MAG: hypothetical protein ACT4P6_21785 [Gemmatimonadaceae bacterium]
MSQRRCALAALLLLLTVPSVLEAQRRRGRPRPTRASEYEQPRSRPVDRHGFGISFNYGKPTGEFGDYVNQGFGADGFYRFALDRYGIASLRVGGQFLIYGNETRRLPLSSTIGNLVLVDVETSNNILNFGGGLELAIPTPAVRPYVFGQLGSGYFFTETSVEGSDDAFEFANTTNYRDWVFSRQVGAGLQIPLGRSRSGSGVQLDLGATYNLNGEARYLREGSIEEVSQGNFVFHPIRSEANLITWRIGMSFTAR